MTIFEELENKIYKSKANYSLTNDGKGKKTYTIFSEELKQSLWDVIHSTAQKGEWQINHLTGTNFIKYRKKQGNEFGVYQKSLLESSPDEFVVLSKGQSSVDREEFIKTKQEFEEHDRAFEEHDRAFEEHDRAFEEVEKQVEDVQRVNSNVSYTGDSKILKEALGILTKEQSQKVQICQEEQSKSPF